MNADTPAAAPAAPPSPSPSPDPWPARHRIGSFELLSVVRASRTGVVYRGWDHALARPVALQEYLPAGLALRDAAGDLHPSGPDATPWFERGRHAFVEEARTLARCDHPSLVRVLALLEVHGTAYRVMPWYSGRLLQDLRDRMAGPLSEPAVRLLLDHLLGALEEYQRFGGVHRHLSPSQVMLLDDGRALLLGPGLADRALQAAAVHTRPQDPFAPPEQAGLPDAQAQGPWSDFFALAGVARFCITGQAPAAAESSEPLAQAVARQFGHLPSTHFADGLLQLLDEARAADIAQRPQTAALFREALLRSQAPRLTTPARTGAAEAATGADRTAATSALADGPASTPLADDAAGAELIRWSDDSIPGGSEPMLGPLFDPAPATGTVPAFAAEPRVTGGRRNGRWSGVLWAGLAAGLAAIAVGAWQLQAPPYRLTLEGLTMAGLAAGVDKTEAPPLATPAADNPAATAAPTPPSTPAAPPAAPRAAPPESPSSPTPAAERAASPPPARSAAAAATTTSSASSRDARSPRAAKLASASPATELTSPRQECGARTEFSLYRCMQQQCSQARWQQHPLCLRLEATDRIE